MKHKKKNQKQRPLMMPIWAVPSARKTSSAAKKFVSSHAITNSTPPALIPGFSMSPARVRSAVSTSGPATPPIPTTNKIAATYPRRSTPPANATPTLPAAAVETCCSAVSPGRRRGINASKSCAAIVMSKTVRSPKRKAKVVRGVASPELATSTVHASSGSDAASSAGEVATVAVGAAAVPGVEGSGIAWRGGHSERWRDWAKTDVCRHGHG